MSRLIIFQIIAGIAGGILAYSKGRNYLVWSLLCFFFPFLVLVILLIPSKVARGRTKQCPYCSSIISESEAVCSYCKKELPINLVQCKECGSYVPEREYCMQCNKKLKY